MVVRLDSRRALEPLSVIVILATHVLNSDSRVRKAFFLHLQLFHLVIKASHKILAFLP